MDENALKYSLVVPVYKDAYLADSFCTELHVFFCNFLKTSKDVSALFELIFVADGGCKQDEITLKEICTKYPFVKAIFLSRNFGQHIAISAGYSKASGEYICFLNIDQQEPISELEKYFFHIEKNNLDLVYGLREVRNSSFTDRVTSKFFNGVFNFLTKNKIPVNIATTRVMSRRFVDAYNNLSESERFLPGLENWLGFDVGYIPTIHMKRQQGKSSYTLKKRFAMAESALISFSDVPLRLMVLLGFILTACGFMAVLIVVFLKLFVVSFQAGYVSLISIIIFSSGLILSLMGFSSLYIGKILKEVQRRPLFIIKEKINLS
jgi:glycosyltransferase involved in cell wall biosynthesis